MARGNFINNIFEYNHKGIEVFINDKCSYTITDLLNTKEAQDGTKHKQKAKDKETGVTSEKYGHMTDCLDYQICIVFKKQFNEYLKGDKPAIQRIGQNIQGHRY